MTGKAVAVVLGIGLCACAPVRQRAPSDATVVERVGYYVSRLSDRRYVETGADREAPIAWHVAAEELGLIGIGAVPALIGRLEVPTDVYERQQVFYALRLAVQHPNALPSAGRDYPMPIEAFPPADAHAALTSGWLSWWEAHREAVTAAAGGVGQPVPEWPAKPRDQWVQGGPLTLADLRGKVVLIRFFMDPDCPYCRGTAPTLNEFHDEFAAGGLVVIGMFTPKPRPRPVAVDEVRGYVKAFRFEFPIAIDADWGALRRLWLDVVPDAEYTSSSLLVDRHGILRHVQKGGVYAKDATDAQARRDYLEMRKAIVTLLSAP